MRSTTDRRAAKWTTSVAWLTSAMLAWPGAAVAADPIMVLMDLHADPMAGPIPAQRQEYLDWVNAGNWLLDLLEPRGGVVSFLSTGEFVEWVAGDPTAGPQLIQRLYASGDMIGTHSHDRVRFGAHDWRPLPPEPTPAQVLQLWNDHVSTVDTVIGVALGITEPAEVRAVNCARGSHTPDDDAWRLQLMADFGFTIHQQGPERRFYAYFRHYPMNTYRPSGGGIFLEHDPSGPVVLSPFGPALGTNDVSFGVAHDMRVPAVQGRFLLEVLNWLHDAHVAGTERVWVSGWGSHMHDIVPGAPTRLALPLMLDWLEEHFIGRPVGGHVAAAYSSMRGARDAYFLWESSHPSAVPFTYPAETTNWDLYPYLVPTASYLIEAWYEAAMPPTDTVRGHELTASAAAGGPYRLHVVYTTDGVPVTQDLSPWLGPGEVAAVNPATGCSEIVPTDAVPVPPIGALLVPVDRVMVFPRPADVNGDGTVDVLDLLLVLGAWGPCPGCPEDVNGDGFVNVLDLLEVLTAWGPC